MSWPCRSGSRTHGDKTRESKKTTTAPGYHVSHVAGVRAAPQIVSLKAQHTRPVRNSQEPSFRAPTAEHG